MSFLKIGTKQMTIQSHSSIVDFLFSITGSNIKPKTFSIKTTNGEKFNLQISSIQKEDGSGNNFLFTASGETEDGNSKNCWIPIKDKIEGFIRF